MPSEWYRPVAVGFQRESVHPTSNDPEELHGGDGPCLDFKVRHMTEANMTRLSGVQEMLRRWAGLGC